jgi:hypothetical protein
MGEFVANERSQGFMVGLAIPLWQNKNVVRQARAEALSSESMAEDSRVRYYNHRRSLYNQAVGLQQSVNLYTASLNENGHDSLLLKAYEKGELSLLEYLLEMEYFYECFRKRAIAERDLDLFWRNLQPILCSFLSAIGGLHCRLLFLLKIAEFAIILELNGYWGCMKIG